MIYAANDKCAMDNILKAFAEYIRGQDYFDIVYSDKIGYVKLKVHDADEDPPEVMDSPEALLGNLFYEMINDVVYSPDNPNQEHYDYTLTEYEETESRRRITAILETMEEKDKGRYLGYLDYCIKKYQERDPCENQ